MDRLAERSESFVITKRGKPVARLVPIEDEAPQSLLGALRGLARETGDIVSPAEAPSAWQTLEEWDELNAPEPRKPRRRRVASRRQQ